jgi:uncharacterized protein (DUF1800 family)
MRIRRILQLACLVALGSSVAAASPNQVSVTPKQASRFLAQATLGADWEEIQRTAKIGYKAWLEEQYKRPVGYQRPALDQRLAQGLEVDEAHRRWAWWAQVLQGPDPLRQRVALALSEIFVVSDNLGDIGDNPQGLADYYDTLLGDAFGNYRDLLRDVTLHPIMGVYLSHLRNEKSSGGRFPDENYAREIMQLFSIGLFRLRDDGTQIHDAMGQPIPTYDNGDITEMAKIFTGLSFASPDYDFDEGTAVWTAPMRMYDAFHEPGPKNLLRGMYVPAGQTGMHDLENAIDDLFNHPNVGPFIGRRLIQRLITSNPSPGYLQRVSAAFADNGKGVRGDLRAVISAILLDPEARKAPISADIHRGRLRESFLRRVHLARAFDASNLVASFPISDGDALTTFAQRPLSSPTVFNFFLPDYQPTGEILDAGLFAPEFQIINAVTALTSANSLGQQVRGTMNNDDQPALEVRLDLSDEIGIATDVKALLDRLDLLLMYGDMSAGMRQVLSQALVQLPDLEQRTEMAVHLIAFSPEYCVVK